MWWIFVRTHFEAFHYWKNAPKEVEFLQHPHRHIFEVQVKLKVSDHDRQLEYFTVKKHLDKYIARKYKDKTFPHSCEYLASDLKKILAKKYNTDVQVGVLEDGENGSFTIDYYE